MATRIRDTHTTPTVWQAIALADADEHHPYPLGHVPTITLITCRDRGWLTRTTPQNNDTWEWTRTPAGTAALARWADRTGINPDQ